MVMMRMIKLIETNISMMVKPARRRRMMRSPLCSPLSPWRRGAGGEGVLFTFRGKRKQPPHPNPLPRWGEGVNCLLQRRAFEDLRNAVHEDDVARVHPRTAARRRLHEDDHGSGVVVLDFFDPVKVALRVRLHGGVE